MRWVLLVLAFSCAARQKPKEKCACGVGYSWFAPNEVGDVEPVRIPYGESRDLLGRNWSCGCADVEK